MATAIRKKPRSKNKNALSEWIEKLPISLKYETTTLLRRDVTINCRLVNAVMAQ